MSDFGDRLKAAFETQEISELSRKLGVTYQAAKNYVDGRLPSPEKLIEISDSTGCSIDWLLTGKETAKRVEVPVVDPLINRETFADLVREIVRQELQAASVQELGTIDEFDLSAAVAKYDDPGRVMKEWRRHEGLPVKGFSVPVFDGWDKMSLEQKVAQLKAFRDIDRRHVERSKHVLPPKAS